MLAQREPEEVLSLLRATKDNLYVKAFLAFLRKINYDYNKLITYASMYGGEEIANTLREHEDWLRRFLDLLREAATRRRAARKTKMRIKTRTRTAAGSRAEAGVGAKRAQKKQAAVEEDLDFNVGEVQIDLGLEGGEEAEGEGKEEKEEK